MHLIRYPYLRDEVGRFRNAFDRGYCANFEDFWRCGPARSPMRTRAGTERGLLLAHVRRRGRACARALDSSERMRCLLG
eukprot:5911153-Pleurochrysis_carterae.AAC.4